MICVVCGKEFLRSRFSRQLTCSQECQRELCRQKQREYNKRRYEKKYPLRKVKCVICGKEFETRSTKRTCCSKECSQENIQRSVIAYKSKKFEPNPNVEKIELLGEGICRACFKKFEPRYQGEKFCSDKCRFEFCTPARIDALARFIEK